MGRPEHAEFRHLRDQCFGQDRADAKNIPIRFRNDLPVPAARSQRQLLQSGVRDKTSRAGLSPGDDVSQQSEHPDIYERPPADILRVSDGLDFSRRKGSPPPEASSGQKYWGGVRRTGVKPPEISRAGRAKARPAPLDQAYAISSRPWRRPRLWQSPFSGWQFRSGAVSAPRALP